MIEIYTPDLVILEAVDAFSAGWMTFNKKG